ncbi:mucoidy inhibitor MuiA family protein [Marivirga sp. S37H4]|uniref:Mucoidy inhibitor MuiA family protein n=1 Tax=Marivirga aurantiaca TaxID=2802615 RepID=A0A935C5V6_9BACT|nr:DUF4139 domain-containing protein [Marivirga aurantiaca]MBK6264025.1 mucoidy inhibitor MuiA family protein [Marivirga aurantiaca]
MNIKTTLISSFFVLFLQPLLFGQVPLNVTMKTEIKEATVFLQGAQVFRSGATTIEAGKSSIVMKSLSPHLDDKSIQVKGEGDFTILSVNRKFNYLNELSKDKQIDSLTGRIDILEKKLSNQAARLEVLKEKQSVLDQNKELKGNTNSLQQLKQAIEFYDKELTAIKSEELKIYLERELLEQEKQKLQSQVNSVKKQKDFPSSEIVIQVESVKKVQANFTISYFVQNAGWYPKYDVKVTDVESPVNISYKASVYQNTGVDWDNVRLKFSNTEPNKGNLVPKLEPWLLNFNRNTHFRQKIMDENFSNNIGDVYGIVTDEETGEPLPGANVMVKSSNIGTTTDLSGRYSLTLPQNAQQLVISFIGMETKELPINSPQINVWLRPDVQQLSEVVVTGYGYSASQSSREVKLRGVSSLKKAETITTRTIENQKSVEFEVEEPYTIKTNWEALTVDLKDINVEAIYEYYAVPKLDKNAFLMARIINWEQFNLLEGEANLFFEGGYVGRTILDANILSDTLDISLGRDKSIMINREKVDEFTKRRFIGSNQTENVGFNITVRNKKSQAVKLILFDQVPVSANSNIEVIATDISGGKLEDKTGEISWELKLAPQKQQELKLQYEVKYPKNEQLILE